MTTTSSSSHVRAPEAWSVSELTLRLKSTVEEQFADVWVAGEISNFSQPQSGHCYFTLKDDAAQLRAVLWKNAASRLKAALQDGLQVVCRGRLDVYPPRGSYQLVVQQLELQGIGALELAFKQLREKLAAEGLFDARRKRPLPKYPRRIGVVTSPTGAALRDFLEVLRRRWQDVEVLVLPARVQGDGAEQEITAGIRAAQRLQPPLDVLVVTRGGGSLEDLWCFNHESVVRAIAASRLPTVSAIGHEIDVTLADFAADVRALTPSEAAERVVPSAEEASDALDRLGLRLAQALRNRAAHSRARLDALASRPSLTRPADMVRNLARRVDELSVRLRTAGRHDVQQRRAGLAGIGGKLHSLSPLSVLRRGYSVTTDWKTGALLERSRPVKVGQRVLTRLAEGSLLSIVEALDVAEPLPLGGEEHGGRV
jgi:exodeoxyribonuclease VII large subunit